MNVPRETLLLAQIRQACEDALVFTAGMDRQAFLLDRKTQQAVAMSLMVIGEAVAKLVKTSPDFLARHPEAPWSSNKGPLIIIEHDRPAYVLLANDEYQRLVDQRRSIFDRLAMSGSEDIELDLPKRTVHRFRDIDLT